MAVIKGDQLLNIIICGEDQKAISKIHQAVENIAEGMHTEFRFIKYKTNDDLIFHYEYEAYNILLIVLDEDLKKGTEALTAAHLLRSDYQYQGPIVFISNNDNKSVAAYDVHAFHYIIKNTLSKKRIEEIIYEAISDEIQKREKRIFLHGQKEYRYISLNQIYCFEINGHTITVQYEKHKSFDFCHSMNHMEEWLSKKGFIRVHRSYLINSDKIDTVTNAAVTLTNGMIIPIGRKYYPKLREYLLSKD